MGSGRSVPVVLRRLLRHRVVHADLLLAREAHAQHVGAFLQQIAQQRQAYQLA